MNLRLVEYGGEADYERMRRFLVEIQPLNGTRQYCTIGDLDWWRWTDDPATLDTIALWEDDQGKLLGFAWPNDDELDFIVHPAAASLDDAVLSWAEARRRQEEPDRPTLTAWSYESHSAREEILRRRGYSLIEKAYLQRRRSLVDPLPDPVLPPGYVLRHVTSEADVERRVAVHRDAFAPSRMTAAKHRAVMGAATYRPELDLVVVAPDDSFAAFAIVWYDQANRIGVFEPVGTHSAHRRLGLGQAIMFEGMRRLRSLGATTAIVVSLAGGEAANALYDSVGLTAVDRCRGWRMTL